MPNAPFSEKCAVEDLPPRTLWRHFARIAAIPHGSGNEAGLRTAVRELAADNGLDHQVDAAGNLRVRLPATARLADRPATVLQAHLDMVCESRPERRHDFEADPLRLRIDRDRWVTAEATTLGADNGIGVAAMMALMTAGDVDHGPLELLFTVAEETGMHGARGLGPDWLSGRRLINLDAEQDDTLIIGCAGSRTTVLTLDLETEPSRADAATAVVRIAGLTGGHSGMDIHRGRANPIRLLVRLLQSAGEVELGIVRLAAGKSLNALAREAEATVCYPVGRWRTLAGIVAAMEQDFQRSHGRVEPGMAVTIEAMEHSPRSRVWTESTRRRSLDLLTALPHGVLAVRPTDPGLVETSTNLASVAAAEGRLRIDTKQRSLTDHGLAGAAENVEAVGRLAGAAVTQEGFYPPWTPQPHSRLLETARGTYRRLFDAPARVAAMHAGLECGLIAARYPGMDIVALGPNIHDPHSPDERVEIASVAKFWRFLTTLLGDL